MTKKPRKKEICYRVLIWTGRGNDLHLTGEACLRCRKPFTTDGMMVVFYIEGMGELAELCWLCADFWRESFASVGIKTRYIGPEKLRLVSGAST